MIEEQKGFYKPLFFKTLPPPNNMQRYLDKKFDIKIKSGGRNWIRTSEGVSQQIYSLPPLAAWVSYHPQRKL